MNRVYNNGSRPAKLKRPQLSGLIPSLDEGKIIRWVIVPGATVLGAIVISRILKRRKK